MRSTRSAKTALRLTLWGFAFLCAAVFLLPAAAETGAEGWLRYSRLSPQAADEYKLLPPNTVLLGNSVVLKTAQQELLRAVALMQGRKLQVESGLSPQSAIILGTFAQLHSLAPELHTPEDFRADGYWLKRAKVNGRECLIIAARNDRGVLYGVFALLSKVVQGETLPIDEVQQPYAPIRWVNQWDNLSIERGYGGPSIFFENGNVRGDLTRASEYARLLASIGINGCTINNVNAAPGILQENFIAQVSGIADVFRPWGVQLSLSVDLSSPKIIGGLDTFDPLDPRVAEWWRKKV